MSYYFRVRGKVYGPYTEQQIRGMQTKGSISRTTEISDDGQRWIQAAEYEFLYTQPAKLPEPTNDVDKSQLWFYSVEDEDAGTNGPMPATNICFMIIAGELNAYSRVWQEGESPRLLRSVSQFAECLPQRQRIGAFFALAILLAAITLGVGVFAMLQKPLPTTTDSKTPPAQESDPTAPSDSFVAPDTNNEDK